jgi:16S rRNA (cytosine967-C5)-methyltransferase
MRWPKEKKKEPAMTPAARLSAAISVLDDILSGRTADQALTAWGRSSRFAGSGDRHAVRDLVFDALRCKRSFAAYGGSMTGRGLILGALRAKGINPDSLFTGQGHAPAVIDVSDQPRSPTPYEALDIPDWLAPHLMDSLGDDFTATLQAMQIRAPVYLRVNNLRGDVTTAQTALAQDGVETTLISNVNFGLQVISGERKIQNSMAYQSGLVELQDAASQAVIEALDIAPNSRILDYCAGGGGKTLALAAKTGSVIYAHDAAPRRMADLPKRAARANAQIEILENTFDTKPYDVILTDAPCSGSGSWRRDPMGKWALTQDRLQELIGLQSHILDQGASLLAPMGTLAYATCSMLRQENEAQVDRFLQRHKDFTLHKSHRFSPLQGGDGFFLAILTKNPTSPTFP